MIGFETHEGCVVEIHATERPPFIRVLSTPGVKSGQTNGGRHGNSIIPLTCRGSRSLAEQQVTRPHPLRIARRSSKQLIPVDVNDSRRSLDKSHCGK